MAPTPISTARRPPLGQVAISAPCGVLLPSSSCSDPVERVSGRPSRASLAPLRGERRRSRDRSAGQAHGPPLSGAGASSAISAAISRSSCPLLCWTKDTRPTKRISSIIPAQSSRPAASCQGIVVTSALDQETSILATASRQDQHRVEPGDPTCADRPDHVYPARRSGPGRSWVAVGKATARKPTPWPRNSRRAGSTVISPGERPISRPAPGRPRHS